MLRAVLLISLLTSWGFAMSQEQLALWIEHAVRQSVRTQKMTKEALLIRMDIEPKKNSKRMKFTIDKLRADLNAFLGKGKKGHLKGDTNIKLVPIKSADILAKIHAFASAWHAVEKRAVPIYTLRDVRDENVNFLIQNNHDLLRKNQTVVSALMQQSEQGGKHLKYANDIRHASEIKMLTQMISKDMLIFVNHRSKSALKELIFAYKKIDKIFQALYHGDAEMGCNGTQYAPLVHALKKSQKIWQEAKKLTIANLKSKQIDSQRIIRTIARLDALRVQMRKAGVIYVLSINRQKQNIALAGIVHHFMANKNSAKHLINLAGKQRMLTQRISKLSIECAHTLREGSCLKMLQSVKSYNKTLRAFRKGNQEINIERLTSTTSIAQLAAIKALWNPFVAQTIKLIKSNGRDRDALAYILDRNVPLLRASDALVKILSKERLQHVDALDKMVLQIVNIAGKERMLTQKMTKEYLQLHTLNQAGAQEKMVKTMQTFDTILSLLFQGNTTLKLPKVTNLSIKKQLVLVRKIWRKLKPLYLKKSLSRKKLALLLKANPILLHEMDKAVGMIDRSTNY